MAATPSNDVTRTVAVTGAAGGIGAAFVGGFVAAGWRVLAIDKVATQADSDAIQNIALDVTDSDAVTDWGRSLVALDLLINAAGIIRRNDEFDPATFAQVVDINLNGAMRMSSAARTALMATPGSSIINIASMLSQFGGPLVPGYTASKTGIVGLTRALAVAWAPDGIRVNAIAPGWIETPMTAALRDDRERERIILGRTPMQRWGRAEELVGPALFLASSAAAFVTGVTLPVDGGYSAM